jgi:hypothetical protein
MAGSSEYLTGTGPQHLVHVVDHDDLHGPLDLRGDLLQILLVLLGDQDGVDATAVGRDHLLLEAADQEESQPGDSEDSAQTALMGYVHFVLSPPPWGSG